MNEIVSPIMLGITSSLVATFIFLSTSWIMKNVVLPWYEDKIYRGVRIDGVWIRTELNGHSLKDINRPIAKMTLKQKGDYITGLYCHGADTVNGEDRLESYSVTGHISNSFVTLTMKPLENDNIDAAAGILHIFNKDNKLQLKGKKLFISSSKAEVLSVDSISFEKST
jgi:hypothetical protein